jgi:hypothetical protein
MRLSAFALREAPSRPGPAFHPSSSEPVTGVMFTLPGEDETTASSRKIKKLYKLWRSWVALVFFLTVHIFKF